MTLPTIHVGSALALRSDIFWGRSRMQWRNSPERYGAVVQISHWITVLLILFAWLIGQFHDAFPKGPPRSAAMWFHKEAGVLVIAILAFRLLWRFVDPPPAFEKTPGGVLADRAAKLAHWVLYLLMLAVPVAGIVLSFARGRPVDLFGFYEIASPWVEDRALAGLAKQAHEWLANGLLIFAFLHAVAALVHHWVLHDSTLRRMLPGRAV
jgi:cytochrome b561